VLLSLHVWDDTVALHSWITTWAQCTPVTFSLSCSVLPSKQWVALSPHSMEVPCLSPDWAKRPFCLEFACSSCPVCAWVSSGLFSFPHNPKTSCSIGEFSVGVSAVLSRLLTKYSRLLIPNYITKIVVSTVIHYITYLR